MGKKNNFGWDYLNDNMKFFKGDEESWSCLNGNGSGSYNGADGSWGYLNSDGSGSYNGADGSWGYRNSDGSGSYNGADGSWGYWNADGSASYNGADGSWGYRNSDGSGSYNGADGSWGYWNSDGSASYNGSDGSYEYLDADEKESYHNTGSSMNYKNKYGSSSYYFNDKEIKREQVKKERQEKRKKKRKKFFRKHWKGVLKTVLLLVVIIVVGFAYWEYKNWIPVNVNSSDVIGSDYEYVEECFEDAGFINVYSWGLYDLEADELSKEGSVAEITVDEIAEYNKNSKFRYDSDVVIKYHSAKLVDVPISAKEAKGENYKKIRTLLKEAGFVNIIIDVEYDLITGWINQDGDIKEIIIDGESDFEAESSYRVDSEVKIIYHTFKKNKK